MRFCTNCGSELGNDDVFCPNCGTPVEGVAENTPESHEEKVVQSEPPRQKFDYNEVASKVSEGADKAMKTAEVFAGKAAKTASEAAAKAAKSAEELKKNMAERAEQKKAEVEAEVARRGSRENEESVRAKRLRANSFEGYMSDSELWSWLKKDSKRQQFFTDEVSPLTDEEFMRKVQDRMDESGVPAEIERRKIQWDRSSIQQDVFIVKPNTSVASPISYLLQFNHVGKFTFVEEKSFITPPNLPDVPLKKLSVPTNLGKMLALMVYGVLAILVGVCLIMLNGVSKYFDTAGTGGILLLIGAMLFLVGLSKKSELDAINKHNKKCDEMEKAWTDAWANWENTIFLHSFQEDINGQLSRIYDSVFGCIKQVCSEEFDNCAREQEDSSNMNELEQLIARRKDDYR